MLDAIRDFLANLQDRFAWAPDWLIGLCILALAALLALSVHGTIVRVLRRLLRDRYPYVRNFLTATTGLTRLATLVIFLFIALAVAPFDDNARTGIAKGLLLVGIALIGWAAITAVNMTADLYLMRFRLGGADSITARKHLTQVRLLTRTCDTLLVIATVGGALMTFDAVRTYGVSLFASAGVAGLVAGLAARPVLSNLFAGIQIAMTQPIRIDDGVMVEGEFGRVEEITSTYVVLRLPDLRRLIVPLAHFIERPFQNWTREASGLIGTVTVFVDYTAPVERIRAKAIELVKASPLWDGEVVKLQVTDARESTLELRVTASARSAGDAFDLRCEVREKLVDFLQRKSRPPCPAHVSKRSRQRSHPTPEPHCRACAHPPMLAGEGPKNQGGPDAVITPIAACRCRRGHLCRHGDRLCAGARADAGQSLVSGGAFPEASEEVLGATAGGKLYAFSGLAPGFKPRALVYEYDPATNQWSKKKPMQLATHHVAFTTLNDKIYAFGGFVLPDQGPPAWNPIDNAWEYDPATDEWKALAPMPTKRGAAAAGVFGGKLYVTGGANSLPGVKENGIHPTRPHNVMGTVEEYDPSTNAWRTRRPLLLPRNHHVTAAAGDKLYVIGGRVGSAFITGTSNNVDLVETYDPAADLWSARLRMPTARSAMGWGVYDNRYIVTAGGEGQDQRFLAAFKSVEAFDTTLNRWLVLPSMPRQRHGLAAGVVGNRFYAVSGDAQSAGNGIEHSSVNVNEALQLDFVIK